MEKIIYLVSSGEYSDYGVRGVFSNRENAQAYIDKYKWRWAQPQIEEYRLDFGIKETVWSVEMFLEDGNHANAHIEDYPRGVSSECSVHGMKFRCKVVAKDKKHAIKLANTRRIIYKSRVQT